MLYGAITQIPYFGIAMTEYAEKERDLFLLMYIAGGSLLPQNEKISKVSLPLVRRSYKKAFRDPAAPTEPIGPYASGSTLDLPAFIIRILYWLPPSALALLFLVILLPHQSRSKEDEL
jgi:hypothetical protein